MYLIFNKTEMWLGTNPLLQIENTYKIDVINILGWVWDEVGTLLIKKLSAYAHNIK